MSKKIGVIFSLLFVLFSNRTLAHTGLEESVPRDGEVLIESVQELTLIFATKIEQTSSITVTTTNGEIITLEEMLVEENQIKAIFPQPLQNGSYQVKWDIIGADGHPVEGTLVFSVDARVAETEVEQEEIQEKTLPLKVEESKVDTVNEFSENESQQMKISSNTIRIVIVALCLVVIAVLWWNLRRKR